MKMCFEFKPQDLWVGVFWKRTHDGPTAMFCNGERVQRIVVDLWLCLIPMLPIHFTWTDYRP